MIFLRPHQKSPQTAPASGVYATIQAYNDMAQGYPVTLRAGGLVLYRLILKIIR